MHSVALVLVVDTSSIAQLVENKYQNCNDRWVLGEHGTPRKEMGLEKFEIYSPLYIL